MRTAIGMWICVILAFASFFAGIMHDHEFIGCIAGLFFVFLGFKIFNNLPKEFRDAVHELQKQEENEKEYKKCMEDINVQVVVGWLDIELG